MYLVEEVRDIIREEIKKEMRYRKIW